MSRTGSQGGLKGPGRKRTAPGDDADDRRAAVGDAEEKPEARATRLVRLVTVRAQQKQEEEEEEEERQRQAERQKEKDRGGDKSRRREWEYDEALVEELANSLRATSQPRPRSPVRQVERPNLAALRRDTVRQLLSLPPSARTAEESLHQGGRREREEPPPKRPKTNPPSPDSSSNSSSQGSSGRRKNHPLCLRCGLKGHWKWECHEPELGSGAPTCFRCDQPGHQIRNCPLRGMRPAPKFAPPPPTRVPATQAPRARPPEPVRAMPPFNHLPRISPQGACRVCLRFGHDTRDCWYNSANQRPGAWGGKGQSSPQPAYREVRTRSPPVRLAVPVRNFMDDGGRNRRPPAPPRARSSSRPRAS